MEAFLPRMIRFILLKRKARFQWSQSLEHVKDNDDQAENHETWILILALLLTGHEMQRHHIIPLDLSSSPVPLTLIFLLSLCQ